MYQVNRQIRLCPCIVKWENRSLLLSLSLNCEVYALVQVAKDILIDQFDEEYEVKTWHFSDIKTLNSFRIRTKAQLPFSMADGSSLVILSGA